MKVPKIDMMSDTTFVDFKLVTLMIREFPEFIQMATAEPHLIK